jgi:VanZ family protein
MISKPYGGPERRAGKPSATLGLLCLLGIVAIAFATLCPQSMRPHLASADLERFGAYFGLGVLLGLFLPRRWPTVLAFIIFLAFGLELGQLFAPGRDAAPGDALVKALGGAIGVVCAVSSFGLRRALGWGRDPVENYLRHL